MPEASSLLPPRPTDLPQSAVWKEMHGSELWGNTSRTSVPPFVGLSHLARSYLGLQNHITSVPAHLLSQLGQAPVVTHDATSDPSFSDIGEDGADKRRRSGALTRAG